VLDPLNRDLVSKPSITPKRPSMSAQRNQEAFGEIELRRIATSRDP
jgi:hypothetical protein